MRSSIWRGTISFGLINIPVAVKSAQKDTDLHFNLLDQRTLSPIRFKRVSAKTGEIVPTEKIVKGYQYQKGKYVLMSDADFKNANPKASQTIDIQDFIKISEIDILLFERPYYLVPETGGEKGYALLVKTLERTQRAAIAKMVMHTKGHLTCLFPREGLLIMEVMRFGHEIKSPKEFLKQTQVKIDAPFNASELKLAVQLVNEMTMSWKSNAIQERYRDTYYIDLKRHIDAKIKSGKGQIIETEVHEHPFEVTPTIDFMSHLKASLGKQGKKPTPSAWADEVAEKSAHRRSRGPDKRKVKQPHASKHLH